jgi:hypothetical protein
MAGNLAGAWLGAEALAAAMGRIERSAEIGRLADALATLGWAAVPQ